MAAIVREAEIEAEDRRLTRPTIFAPATGAPPAAIAIVRVSGPTAWQAAARLAGPLPPARTASLRRIADPADGSTIDRGIVLLFDAAASPTGEPVAEFHVHGGRAVVEALSAALAREPDARPAEPGEFTWRAFENGRLDLSRIEGLADLIHAETDSQRRAAIAIAEGGLSAKVEGWRIAVLDAAAAVEAALDFSDEADVPAVDPRALLSPVAGEMRELLDAPTSERLHDGIRVVLAGPPNAGKSSLLNALVGREAAIVSSIAGTTRDRIDVPAMIGGVAVRLTDTAGLRDASDDPIERIGIDRAERSVADADVVLWLGDGPPPATTASVVLLHPRCDLPERADVPAGRIGVSALSGIGLDVLASAVAEIAASLFPREGAVALSNRQHRFIREATEAIGAAIASADLLVAAEYLRTARGSLDRLTGRAGVESMFDALFQRFCIGK